MIYVFDNGLSLHIHLGLFGRFHLRKLPAPEPKGAVRVRMISLTHALDINGPNTCEVLDGTEFAALVARIGPDVLRKDADSEGAFQRISKSRASIGRLLMDQSVMAGIGNIYRSEILWRQRVPPDRPGNQVTRETFERLWADAVKLLMIGVKNDAIITVDGMRKSRSKYGERVNIFNKGTCPACSGATRRFDIAGRRVFACDCCQADGAMTRADRSSHPTQREDIMAERKKRLVTETLKSDPNPEQQYAVDDASDDSFPASDPPAWTTTGEKSVAAKNEKLRKG